MNRLLFNKMSKYCKLFIILIFPNLVLGNIKLIDINKEEERTKFLVELIILANENNDRDNFVFFGNLSDNLFQSVEGIVPFTFIVMDLTQTSYDIPIYVPYKPNTVIIKCLDFNYFELSFLKLYSSPYWYPHSNLILYLENDTTKNEIAMIYFILWHYRVSNAIILHYKQSTEMFVVSYYNPYVNNNYSLQNNYGCWTAKKIGLPIKEFRKSFVCVNECHNVTQHSKLRANNLGTCIGFDVHEVPYNGKKSLNKLNLYEDKGKNLHGYALRAYGTEVKPFMIMEDTGNGIYSLKSRDGLVWTTLSHILNFTIDFTPSLPTIKKQFNYELNIQQIYSLGQRKGELFLLPIYQMDLIIVEIDTTFPYKESGLCIASYRADFETNLFDITLVIKNYDLTIEFTFCFISIWCVFFLFNAVEKGGVSFDQAGKDLVNAFRTILSISLYKGPKSNLFRIFMTTSIWSFFILNFNTQAAIISFFSSFKRGKEVSTFDDVLDKGYNIYGMASPDAVLPETEEKFIKLNQKLVAIQDIVECITNIINDTHRFCLVDCALGRYYKRNKLNNDGEQYLHIIDDRIHSHYLNVILPKYSTMTNHFNKYIIWLFEAGLIKKWEEYRYEEIKDENQIKPLKLDDLLGIFKCYGLFLVLSAFVFFLEVIMGTLRKIILFFKAKIVSK